MGTLFGGCRAFLNQKQKTPPKSKISIMYVLIGVVQYVCVCINNNDNQMIIIIMVIIVTIIIINNIYIHISELTCSLIPESLSLG